MEYYSLFVDNDDRNWKKWQGAGNVLTVCPICNRGNGIVHFLKESGSVDYQDTILCYDCLCAKKTRWLKEHPECRSRSYKKLTTEELKKYDAMIRSEVHFDEYR